MIVGGIVGSLGASGFGGTAAPISAASHEGGRRRRSESPTGRMRLESTSSEADSKTVTPAEDNGSVRYAEVYTADDPVEPNTLETEITYSGLTIIHIPNKMGATFCSEGCGEWKGTK